MGDVDGTYFIGFWELNDNRKYSAWNTRRAQSVKKGRVTQDHCIEEVRLKARPGRSRKDPTWPSTTNPKPTKQTTLVWVHTKNKVEETEYF